MIEVNGISKKYGSKTALKNVSFTAKKGEILGLLGRNGAGKSTAMNIMTGYLSSDEGTVSINGYDILEEPIQAKRGIGYLPEHPPLYLEMTVYDYLEFVCKLKGMERKVIPKFLDDLLERIRIGDVKGRLVGNLSKGYRQRVGLAQALCARPEAVILDEPTVGMDPLQIIEIRQIVRSLGENHTVILSSHILKEIADICTHVVIIDRGKKLVDDSMKNLLNASEGQKSIYLQLSGESGDMVDKLKKIPRVLDVRELHLQEEGFSSFEIFTPAEVDLRETVFREVCAQGRAVVMMKSSQHTLEEVFTRLLVEEEEKQSESPDNP